MNIATLNELKKELNHLQHEELVAICLRLARFKKDNKELMNYLLFESHDEKGYVNSLKQVITEEFAGINNSNLYYAKKSIRRILRLITKHIRYSGKKLTEVELLIHFCHSLKTSNIDFQQSKAMLNLYKRQFMKLQKTLSTMDEDLQYDYESAMDEIGLPS